MYKVGDEVLVRFFSDVNRTYYGEVYICEILAIEPDHSAGKNHIGLVVRTPYKVRTTNDMWFGWVKENEVLSKLSKCEVVKGANQ